MKGGEVDRIVRGCWWVGMKWGEGACEYVMYFAFVLFSRVGFYEV